MRHHRDLLLLALLLSASLMLCAGCQGDKAARVDEGSGQGLAQDKGAPEESAAPPESISPLHFARSANTGILVVSKPGALQEALDHASGTVGLQPPVQTDELALILGKAGWGGDVGVQIPQGLLGVALQPPNDGLDAERPILTSPFEAPSMAVMSALRSPDTRVARALWPTTDAQALKKALLSELQPHLGVDPSSAEDCGAGCEFYTSSSQHLAFQEFESGEHLLVLLVRGFPTPRLESAGQFLEMQGTGAEEEFMNAGIKRALKGLREESLSAQKSDQKTSDQKTSDQKKQTPRNTPALQAALNADLAVWIEPQQASWALTHFQQIEGALSLEAVPNYRKQEFIARSIAQMLNMTVFGTDLRGAEYEDFALRLHTEGELIADMVGTRTAHGEEVSDTLRVSNGAPTPSWKGGKVLDVTLTGDIPEALASKQEALSIYQWEGDRPPKARGLWHTMKTSGMSIYLPMLMQPLGVAGYVDYARGGDWLVPQLVGAQLVLPSLDPLEMSLAMVFLDEESRDTYKAQLEEVVGERYELSTELPELEEEGEGHAALIVSTQGLEPRFGIGVNQMMPELKARLDVSAALAGWLPAGLQPAQGLLLDLEGNGFKHVTVWSLGRVGGDADVPRIDGFEPLTVSETRAKAHQCALESGTATIEAFKAMERMVPDEKFKPVTQTLEILEERRACAEAASSARERFRRNEAALNAIGGLALAFPSESVEEEARVVEVLTRGCDLGLPLACQLERECGVGKFPACAESDEAKEEAR